MRKGGRESKADYVYKQEFSHLLAALMPENRLALEVSLATGLRISDVLNMRTDKLAQRMSVVELKTGKRRAIRLPAELLDRLVAISGKIFVFPGRLDPRRPRTRQAVYKDLRRAATLFRIPEIRGLHLSPHSARKIFAVSEYQKSGSLAKVKKLLNHSDEAVTILYALADTITARNHPGWKPTQEAAPKCRCGPAARMAPTAAASRQAGADKV